MFPFIENSLIYPGATIYIESDQIQIFSKVSQLDHFAHFLVLYAPKLHLFHVARFSKIDIPQPIGIFKHRTDYQRAFFTWSKHSRTQAIERGAFTLHAILQRLAI